MKEESADTVDSVDSEETKSISLPDASSNMTSNSDEKHGKKRNYASDDEDQRPLKVARISPGGSDTPSGEHEDVYIVKSIHQNILFGSPEPVAGCSKDYMACSLNLKDPGEIPEQTDIHPVEEQLDNQEADDESSMPVELMNLSDDVLLIIMSNLKPTDLLNLSS